MELDEVKKIIRSAIKVEPAPYGLSGDIRVHYTGRAPLWNTDNLILHNKQYMWVCDDFPLSDGTKLRTYRPK